MRTDKAGALSPRGVGRWKRFTTAIAVALAIAAVWPAWLTAQGLPLVVTLTDGLEFEGMAGSTDQLSIAAPNPTPYETQAIARIDDGLRHVYFHRNRLVRNTRESLRQETSIPIWQRRTDAGSEGFGQLVSIGPFNAAGHRVLTTGDNDGKITSVVQGITELNPRYCKVQSLLGGDGGSRQWDMRLATGTVSPDVLQALLRGRIVKPDDPAEYLQNVKFHTEAQRYREAIAELEFVRLTFPDLQAKWDDTLAELRQSYGRQILEEVRLRRESGQDDLALALAQALNKEGLAARIGLDFEQEINAILEERTEAAKLREQLLADCQAQVDASATPEEKLLLVEMMAEFETLVDPVTAPRLASYRLRAADPQFSPEQRVGLAISGWILGSSAAIDNYATSQSLITVRGLVREYLRTADEPRRAEILAELAALEGSEPRLLAALVNQLEPPHAPDLSAGHGAEAIRFEVTIPGTVAGGNQPQTIQCLAHVPPGYSPYRRYPLLVALPSVNPAENVLEYWCGRWNPRLGVRDGQAMRYGFVVVSIDWRQPGQNAYGYSAREHAAVLAGTREALRMFAVDSDRVVLAGLGIGAEAAYDIAFSHPDLFAGVAGISGGMSKYANSSRTNIYPPLCAYCVVGQKDTATIGSCLLVWNDWLGKSRYNKCIVVQYIGRLAEPFPEEQPSLLRWAQFQRRFWPVRGDDIEIECEALRSWENRYWFYELSGLPRDRLMLPEEWRDVDKPNPVVLSAKRQANQVNLFTLGPSQGVGDSATLWLSGDFVDFDQQVEIRGRGKYRDFVQPSRKTLLEDVRQRGDRGHPYWARLVEVGRDWQVVE